MMNQYKVKFSIEKLCSQAVYLDKVEVVFIQL